MSHIRKHRKKKQLAYRPNGSVIVRPSVTLIRGPDEAIINALESTPSLAAFFTAALRAYVNRFEAIDPEQRFRRRKDGRLEIALTLEFFPGRDDALIKAIETAPADAIEAAVVEMMRSGGRHGLINGPEEGPELDMQGLGMDL